MFFLFSVEKIGDIFTTVLHHFFQTDAFLHQFFTKNFVFLHQILKLIKHFFV